jgi:hypothetical protein
MWGLFCIFPKKSLCPLSKGFPFGCHNATISLARKKKNTLCVMLEISSKDLTINQILAFPVFSSVFVFNFVM